jgi:uncharacterized protein (TIGR02444 family)
MRPESGNHRAVGEALWRFSLALYARPGVARALVALQDRAGSDVNLVLFGLWLGAVRGRRIDAAALASAVAAIAPLNAVVGELRALRRRLKEAAASDLAALRRQVAAAELAAERRVQHRLAAEFGDEGGADLGGSADRLAAAEANLALSLGGEAGSEEAAVLRGALASLMRRG